MNLINPNNFFPLFLFTLECDNQLLLDDKWLIPDPQSRNFGSLNLIHSNDFNWQKLEVTVGSGLMSLDCSMDVNLEDDERLIDASRGQRSQHILPIDASLTFQPAKSYKLTIDKTNNSNFFSATLPILNDPSFFSSNTEYNLYSSFVQPFEYEIPERFLKPRRFNVNPSLNPEDRYDVPTLNITLDSSVENAIRDNTSEEKLATSYVKVWQLEKVPLGFLIADSKDTNDNIMFSTYLPPPQGGVFPSEVLGERSVKCTPLALSLSIYYCITNDFYDLALLQIKEIIEFSKFSSLVGLPSEFNRVWNKEDIENYQRDFFDNLLFSLVLIYSLQKLDKTKVSNTKIYNDIYKVIYDILDSYYTFTSRETGLVIEGFSESGYTSFNSSLTNSFLLIFVSSLLLNSDYDEKLHQRSVYLLESAKRELFIISKNVNEFPFLNTRFIFSIKLFMEIDKSDKVENYFSILLNQIDVNDLNDESEQDKFLLFYLNSIYSLFSAPSNFEHILRNLYKYQQDPHINIYATTIKNFLDNEENFADNIFNIENNFIEFKENLRLKRTEESFPVNEHWYSKEQLNGLIKELMIAFNKNLVSVDISNYNLDSYLNEYTAKGDILTNLGEVFSIKRKRFETDRDFREKINILKNRDLTKKGIIDWNRLFINTFSEIESYSLEFNYIPDTFYSRVKKYPYEYIFGYPPIEKYIKKKFSSLEEFQKEAINNIDIEGVPGVYILEYKRIKFISWDTMIGVINLNISKGYSREVEKRIESLIPAGIKLNINYIGKSFYGNI